MTKERIRRKPRQPWQFTCKECGSEFLSTRTDKSFCSTECRKNWNNRRQVRGGQIYDLAMKYRADRARGDLGRLCNVIDRFLREDKAKGRTTWSRKPEGLARR